MKTRSTQWAAPVFWLALCASFTAYADVVTDWNITARDIVVESGLHTPPANRVMGIVHTAIYAAANTVTEEYPLVLGLSPAPGASLEAAIAAAAHASLSELLPRQQEKVDAAYQSALEQVVDGSAKRRGLIVGKKAALAVLRQRADDGGDLRESYRPHTTAGAYVPTVIPAVPAWPERRPWFLKSASQFRPGAPPALGSATWARDFAEVKELGRADSRSRTEEQTAIALFWEATLPPIYHGVVHSVALQDGRSPTKNARLFALITQATDDAMIAVFDAKYHYALWRPITAIRNADIDGNEATERDANWTPFIPTPMHPEYPCAHCVVAATVGVILEAEVGDGAMPLLATSSTTADGVIRTWTSVDDFIQEVTDARIYDGVHYRTSGDEGSAMGRQIGQYATMIFR